jgi:predicted nucleotidyltransferase component of viral defense system
MNNEVYKEKVKLLLQLMPFVMQEQVFAVHGGSAINLFVKDMPRYSVDIDLTYIPLADREESIEDINAHLKSIADNAKSNLKGLHIVPKYDACKLLCEYHGHQVKIEVNQTKRGIIGGELQRKSLCDKAQTEFGMFCKAVIVPSTLLYGGKIAAALSRQHPRDLFDVKYMEMPLSDVREGLIFCLLGSDRPIHESFLPQLIDQHEAMENQFKGMTDIEFTYEEFEQPRSKLITDVPNLMTEADKQFLLSFESAEPQWDEYEFAYFRDYPSVQWKLLNLAKLKKQNPAKLNTEVEKLQAVFGC